MHRARHDADSPARPALHPRSDPDSPRRLGVERAHSQQGFSLLEVIIAVFLISMVVLGLATAFTTMMRANRANAEQQQVDHAVDNFAESLKSAAYGECADVAHYNGQPDLWSPAPDGVDVDVEVTDVQYRNGSTDGFDDACTPVSGSDGGTQLLTVRGEWHDRSREAQIVLRRR